MLVHPRPRRRGLDLALGAALLGLGLASCKWSASISSDPRPPPSARSVRPDATTVAVELSARDPDEVTVALRGSRRLVGAPTVELGPSGVAAQPLALASLPGDVYQGTLRGLPADGVLTLAVFGRDDRGDEVRAYAQLAAAAIAPDQVSEAAAPAGDLIVRLPPGALPERTRVLIAPAIAPAPVDAGAQLLTGPYAVGATAGASLAQPAALELLVPRHVDGERLDRASLAVVRWSGAAWTPIGGTAIDSPHGLLVHAAIDALGTYALIGKVR